MTDLAVSHCVAKRQRNVVLAEDFVKALRSEASIERLVAGVELFRCFGHVASLRRPCDTRVTIRSGISSAVLPMTQGGGLGGGCSSQVACGTQNDPLRAAVFRP